MSNNVDNTTLNQLTLFAEDFHVNHTVLQENEKLVQTSEICGESSLELLTKLNHDGYWLKMSQDYCQVNMDGSLEEYLETWPRAGMMQNGNVFQLQPLVRLTEEIGFGLLPTITANSYGANKSYSKNSKMRPSLQTIATKNLWPTPTVCGNYQNKGNMIGLATAVKRWPTPTAHDAKDTGTAPSEGMRKSPCLSFQVGGKLNPQWVEWLMGYPLGWTDLNV